MAEQIEKKGELMGPRAAKKTMLAKQVLQETQRRRPRLQEDAAGRWTIWPAKSNRRPRVNCSAASFCERWFTTSARKSSRLNDRTIIHRMRGAIAMVKCPFCHYDNEDGACSANSASRTSPELSWP